jgi:hypothetical protein
MLQPISKRFFVKSIYVERKILRHSHFVSLISIIFLSFVRSHCHKLVMANKHIETEIYWITGGKLFVEVEIGWECAWLQHTQRRRVREREREISNRHDTLCNETCTRNFHFSSHVIITTMTKMLMMAMKKQANETKWNEMKKEWAGDSTWNRKLPYFLFRLFMRQWRCWCCSCWWWWWWLMRWFVNETILLQICSFAISNSTVAIIQKELLFKRHNF